MQVVLFHPININKNINCSALLDTGSPYTFVPKKCLSQLGVDASGSPKYFEGFRKNKNKKDSDDSGSYPHIISVKIHEKSFQEIEIFDWQRDFVLVGRDLINDFHIGFDGPSLLFTFNPQEIQKAENNRKPSLRNLINRCLGRKA